MKHIDNLATYSTETLVEFLKRNLSIPLGGGVSLTWKGAKPVYGELGGGAIRKNNGTLTFRPVPIGRWHKAMQHSPKAVQIFADICTQPLTLKRV